MCVLLFKILLVVCGYFYAWTSMCCSNTASSFKSVKVCNTLKNSYIFLSWHLFYPFPSVPSVLMWPVCVMTSRFGEFRRASGILVPCPCDVTLSPVKYEWFRCTGLFPCLVEQLLCCRSSERCALASFGSPGLLS